MTAVHVGDILTSDSVVPGGTVAVDKDGHAWQVTTVVLGGDRWWVRCGRWCEEAEVHTAELAVGYGPVTVVYVPGERPWLDATAERMDVVQHLAYLAARLLQERTPMFSAAAGSLAAAADNIRDGEHEGSAHRAIAADVNAGQAPDEVPS